MVDMDGFRFWYKTIPPHHTAVLDRKAWEMHRITRLEKGHVALDIGACIGSYTLELARRFTHVHAFEPNPDNLRVLAKNVRMNRMENVTVHSFALSNQNKQESLRVQRNNGETGTFQDHHYGLSYDRRILVEARTLDSLKLQNVELVKVDVEGWELAVLQGATRTLKEQMPTIALEVHSRSCKGLCEVCEYLDRFGYTVTQIGRADEETPVHWIITS